MAMEIFKLIGSIFVDDKAANESLSKTDKKAQGVGATLLNGVKTAGKWAAAFATATVAAGAAIAKFAGNAVNAYADYEQLAGGVETLFKDSSGTVMEYANRAYKTAGLSANAYMETVTGFSASLLQSLDGDTAAAAKYADQAIIDMSDNANKMGTDMSSIQNAYQGFAKQNYTMLDNLKLGYGGTKEEMQRLLADAEKISGQKYDLSSYADVVEAIHVVQDEMGITGTTAKEAASTISGSVGAMKASWENLMVALASDNADISVSVSEFAETVKVAAGNILPRFSQAVAGIGQAVGALVPVVTAELPGLVSGLLPGLLSAATSLITGLVAAAPGLIQVLVTDILPVFLSGFIQMAESLSSLLPGVVQTLLSALPPLIPQIIDSAVSLLVILASSIDTIIQPLIAALPSILQALSSALLKNLPILVSGAISLAVSLVSYIPQIIEVLASSIPQIISMLVQVLVSNAPQLLAGALQLAVAVISGVVSALGSLLGGLRDVIFGIFSGVWEGIKAIFAPVVDWVRSSIIEPVVAFYDSHIRPIIDKFVEFIGKIEDAFLSAVNWFTTNIVQPIVAFYDKWIAPVVNKLTEMAKKLVEILLAIFVGLFNLVKQKVIDPIANAAAKLFGEIKAIFTPIVEFFKNIFTTAYNAVTAAFSKIGLFFSDAWAKVKSIFSPVTDFFRNAFTSAYNAITSVFSKIGSFFSTIWSKIKNTFSGLGTSIGNAISGAVRTAINGVISKIESTINSAVRLINGAIGLINKLPGVSVGTISGVSLPRLARGGVLERGQTGYLEGTGAEAVVPLENNRKWIHAVAQDMQAAGIGGNDKTVALLAAILDVLERLAEAGIYLDTGKLVGALVGPLDKKLGEIAARRARA